MSDTPDTPLPPLTHGEEMILEVLVARYRLGEWEWPFSTKAVRNIRELMFKGYVHSRSGNVEKTSLVRLTDRAIAEFITGSDFTPSGYKAHADHIASYVDAMGIENVGNMIRAKFGVTS